MPSSNDSMIKIPSSYARNQPAKKSTSNSALQKYASQQVYET